MIVNDVRVALYRSFIEEQRAPMAAEIALEMDVSLHEVENAYTQLHDEDVIALIPGTKLVWLAHPFCALDAPFMVVSAGSRWDAICIWDALGILALLQADGEVQTRCPDCGDEISVLVVEGEVRAERDYVVHFGVPANRWYEDLGHT